MKKVVIIGGGIAGMTAGVLLQKAGFDTMNPIDFMKMGMSMKSMGKVMKEYGGVLRYRADFRRQLRWVNLRRGEL